MRAVATWTVAALIGLVALVGFVLLVNSRDRSELDRQPGAGPGVPYRGEPVLSPALQAAVKRGNVVVLYRDDQPPPGTTGLVPAGGKALERAGQSVLLEREPTLTTALAAVSSRRIEEADTPEELTSFIDYWLGAR